MPRVPSAARRRSRRTDPGELERALVHSSVGALAGGGPRCADCGRTPLLGERLHVYGRGARVCELCRPLHRDEPERTELVRHPTATPAVRLVARAA